MNLTPGHYQKGCGCRVSYTNNTNCISILLCPPYTDQTRQEDNLKLFVANFDLNK